MEERIMVCAEELKKLKELLDNNIITQEDFEEKKKQLLSGSELSENTADAGPKSRKPKKKISKALTRKIMIAASVIVLLLVGYSGATKIIEHNQVTKRAAALEEEIRPIMAEYGLDTYTVKRVDYEYEVFASGFESLTNGEALKCLKALDRVSIDDPCGDGEIDFGLMTAVHPGLDVEYSYWRVSSGTVIANKAYGGNYEVPGIYCNLNGMECIYECDN